MTMMVAIEKIPKHFAPGIGDVPLVGCGVAVNDVGPGVEVDPVGPGVKVDPVGTGVEVDLVLFLLPHLPLHWVHGDIDG